MTVHIWIISSKVLDKVANTGNIVAENTEKKYRHTKRDQKQLKINLIFKFNI